MAAPNNPPQVHLQLGHQTFKRSFHQFGLDVDDADDSETNNVASYSGASSGSTVSSSDNESNSIASGSSSTGRGLRSLSSGSSYSSGGSSDYAGGQRNERNKRARSDGPDTVRILRSDESSSSADSSGSSMPSPSSVGLNSVQHALTPTEYDSEGASSSGEASSLSALSCIHRGTLVLLGAGEAEVDARPVTAARSSYAFWTRSLPAFQNVLAFVSMLIPISVAWAKILSA